MAKKQTKARPQPPKRQSSGGGVGSYILTIFVSAILTAALIAVLVLATASMRNRGGSTTQADDLEVAGAPTQPPTPEPTATPARTGEIASSSQSVNVRAGAGTTFDVVGNVNPGTTVVLLGQNGDGTWQHIQLDNGTTGWVSTSLMRIAAEPTAIPVETTPDPSSTEEVIVVVACEGNEADQWWTTSGSALYAQSKYAVLRSAANQLNNINDLYISVELDQDNFEAADYPRCVTNLRENLLNASQEIMDGLQDYANGQLDGGRNRVANAQTQYLDPTIQTLTTEMGVAVFNNACPLDAWMAGLEEPYTRFTTIVNEFAPGTTPPDQVRPLIFETQRLRQTINDAFTPDCAGTVKGFLIDMVDEAVALFQGVFAGDQAAIQRHQSGFAAARDLFRSEMNRLGLDVS